MHNARLFCLALGRRALHGAARRDGRDGRRLGRRRRAGDAGRRRDARGGARSRPRRPGGSPSRVGLLGRRAPYAGHALRRRFRRRASRRGGKHPLRGPRRTSPRAPPRSKPLAVVLARAPSPEEQARVFAADFKGLPWRVRAFFLPDPSLFDAHARAAGVDVRSGEVHPRDRGHLWEPSDMVARWLPPPRGPHGPRLERRSAPRGRVPAVPGPPSPVPNRRPRGRDLAASVRGRGVRRGKGRGVGGDEDGACWR